MQYLADNRLVTGFQKQYSVPSENISLQMQNRSQYEQHLLEGYRRLPTHEGH
jgi:hypothetical protein